jgi:UDP-N-acetylglucosamine--N-acetylmuramyl-(pentapeptide) pyrophosphoryl-undecaprenol N-acetylglucosamine transferase
MPLFFAASDLVVSRAGAMTVSELAATATPAVVVPLPAGKGYQALNAGGLEQAGGAVVVEQDRMGEVEGIVRRLIADPEELAAMRIGAFSTARPDAADRVASIVKEVAIA